MKKLLAPLFLAIFAFGFGLFPSLATAAGNPAAVEEVALELTELSLHLELAETDPRVLQTRKMLEKAVKLTREEPLAISAACSRYVGHLHDSAHIEARPLDLLEALVTFGKAGKSMRDTLQDYAEARKAATARSHAEAMAALAKKK